MCGCNGTISAESGLAAAQQVFHYVYLNEVYTGRRFSSILAADEYARSIGGSTSPEPPDGFE